ncbi:MAG: hypothetical protein IJ454_02565, partial [Clostridia bacterium]|nr:hypothetical protein [Clostridia bacterium]
VIFMIENNILGKLNEAGETEFADVLKLSADDALDASANSSEDARSLAIEYCTNLEEAMTLLPLIENGSFTFTYALPEDKTFESSAENGIDITLPKGTLLPTDW